METIDYERLRRDLIDYYGTALTMFPQAIMEVMDIKKASYDKLLQYARKSGFNLNNYIIFFDEKKLKKY